MTKTYTTKSNALRAAKQAGFAADQVTLIASANGQFGWQEIATVVKAAVVASKKEILRRSTIERPTKRVWHIADEILAESKAEGSTIKFSRKLVMEECLARGIAFYTARTQFQQWFSLNMKSA